MNAALKLLATTLLCLGFNTTALGQEVTGTPGSPGATTTIDGNTGVRVKIPE